MMTKGFGEIGGNLKQLQTSQKQLYSAIKPECEPTLLEKAQNGVSEASVKQLIDTVNERLKEKRAHEKSGCGLWTSKVRAFGARTDEFLRTFSGLVAIVKGIDENFGPIAFGTLSLFLTVATLKTQYMRTVVDTLETTIDWLPRLEVINALGQQTDQPQIARQVFDIYQETLLVLTSVADHLHRNWLSRTWSIIRKPPEHHLKLQEERIKGKTKLLLEEVLIQNWVQTTHTTKARLDEQKLEHKNQQAAVLTKLSCHTPEMRIVAADEAFPQGMIRQCRAMYGDGTFATYRRAAQPVVRLQEMKLDRIRQQREYAEWAASSDSALLILAGQNYDDSLSQCWVSPAAAELYTSPPDHNHAEHGSTIAAFCSINALPRRRGRSHEDELRFLLLSLVYQLLKADRRLCLENHQRIDDWASETLGEIDDEQHIDACFRLLADIVASTAAQNRTLHVALDGLERWSPPDVTKTLIAGWLELFRDQRQRLKTATATVKVLMTCSRRDTFPRLRETQDRDELRHALGLGANRDLMENVFAIFLKQREIEMELD